MRPCVEGLKKFLATVPAEMAYLDLMQPMKLGLEMTYHGQDRDLQRLCTKKLLVFF